MRLSLPPLRHRLSAPRASLAPTCSPSRNAPASTRCLSLRHRFCLSLQLSILASWIALPSAFAQSTPPPATPTASAKKIRVLTSIAPIASWAQNVAGPFAQVENLLPPNVGPHSFQLRPADVRKIRDSDLIFLNGLGTESWLTKTLQNQKNSGKSSILDLSKGWEPNLIHGATILNLSGKKSRPSQDSHDHAHGDHNHDHDHGPGPNPHVWLDPYFAKHAVTNILKALQTADPAHEKEYSANAAQYLQRLDQLHQDLATVTRRIQSRPLVTYHDAFPYFARRYDLHLVGVIEEVPTVEPSQKYLSQLIRVIRTQKVEVIFTEPQFNPRLARRLASDLKLKVAELDVLETGDPSPEFYENGMRRNLKTLETQFGQ